MINFDAEKNQRYPNIGNSNGLLSESIVTNQTASSTLLREDKGLTGTN